MKEICYYGLNDIDSLKDDWQRLAQGSDMTYFQSWDWYKMLCDLNGSLKHRHFECRLVAVKEDGQTVLIAPLWIVKKDFGRYHKKGIYFFGGGQWTDYVNFIYQEVDKDTIDFLLTELRAKYGIENFNFRQIPDTSQMFSVLASSPAKCGEFKTKCVALQLPDTVEEYQKMLSKHSMQNIRTARNRAAKDGLEFIYNFNDGQVDIAEFASYRKIRVKQKNEVNTSRLRSLISGLVNRVLGYKSVVFADYTPFVNDSNSRFLTLKAKDGKLCAAFNYAYDPVQKSILIMAVSINPEYYRYSPGILLLYNFISHLIEEKKIKTVDFTRGDEPYKFALGGVEKTITRFELNLNKIC